MSDQRDPGSEHHDAGTPAVPDLPGLPDLGALGGDGIAGLLEQAQQAMAAHQEAAQREIEGVAGGGVVRIRATGSGDVRGVDIAPEVVDPADVAMLEDLVLAALKDLSARMTALQQEALGGLGGLGDLGGLLGGEPDEGG